MEQQLISKEINDFARAFLGGTQQGFYKAILSTGERYETG
jgi:hypothetical protein